MNQNVKTTLMNDGNTFFGPGGLELFQHIRNTGSVRDAATRMGLSYSKAWKIIRLAEENMGEAMVERSKGGEGGGGCASLTPAGEELLRRYRAFDEEVKIAAEEIFRRHFDGR